MSPDRLGEPSLRVHLSSTSRVHLTLKIKGSPLTMNQGAASLAIKELSRSRLAQADRGRLAWLERGRIANHTASSIGGPHHFRGLMARPKGHIISSMLLRWGHSYDHKPSGVTLHISSPSGSHYTSMPSCSRGHMSDYMMSHYMIPVRGP